MPRKPIEEGERLRQMLTAARLYYVGEGGEKKTLLKISHKLDVSTTQVARLLEEAEEKGYVKVQVTPPLVEDLACKLRQKFSHLEEVRVIPAVQDAEYSRRMLGRTGAKYFEENVRDGATVAIGSGSTLYDMVTGIPERSKETSLKITIVPSVIMDTGPELHHIDSSILVARLWIRSGQGGTAYFATGLPSMYAPGHLKNKEKSRDLVRRDYANFAKRYAVRTVLEEMKQADFIFLGLGCLKQRQELEREQKWEQKRPHQLAGIEMSSEDLLAEGIVGDFNSTYFNQDGKTSPKWNFFPCLELGQMRKMMGAGTKVVVLAGGAKLPALKVAAKAGFFNVLITDDGAARGLLEA
jgi:DNA-binding transcriptional regulator LsrR (DeoR family)